MMRSRYLGRETGYTIFNGWGEEGGRAKVAKDPAVVISTQAYVNKFTSGVWSKHIDAKGE